MTVVQCFGALLNRDQKVRVDQRMRNRYLIGRWMFTPVKGELFSREDAGLELNFGETSFAVEDSVYCMGVHTFVREKELYRGYRGMYSGGYADSVVRIECGVCGVGVGKPCDVGAHVERQHAFYIRDDVNTRIPWDVDELYHVAKAYPHMKKVHKRLKDIVEYRDVALDKISVSSNAQKRSLSDVYRMVFRDQSLSMRKQAIGGHVWSVSFHTARADMVSFLHKMRPDLVGKSLSDIELMHASGTLHSSIVG